MILKTKEFSKLIGTLCLLAFFSITACNTGNNTSARNGKKKIGILLVNHGSRSATWRQALLDLESRVKDSILGFENVAGIKTAHMEYTEPSIATRLKEFDKDSFTDIIIIPIFLTVSPHSFDDIPTIIGQKEDPQSKEALKLEKIARYTPKAKTYITPTIDFTDALKKNILRRVQKLSVNPKEEGLTLIAYGDETYVKEWRDLMNTIGNHIAQNTGIEKHSFGWCGHIAHYNPDSTTIAINEVLKTKKKSIVIPVLVAHDEMFQIKIIGDGIAKVPDNKNRVIYKPDAILPDENIDQWVIDIARKFVLKVKPD